MASMSVASSTRLLIFNLLFFTLVSSTYVPCPPPPNCTPKIPNIPSKPTKPTKPSIPSIPRKPSDPSKAPSSKPSTCPKDTLKLGVCANLLGGGLISVIIGNPPVKPCCALIDGLVDLEAAICLCTAIKANVLGINLNIPLSLSVLLNACGKKVPSGWKCA